MSKLADAFLGCREEGRKAFIPFLAAGDPDWPTTRCALQILDQAGSDIIELGIPFSDPIADGPIIQASYQRALCGGISLRKTLKQLRGVHLKAPLVLFTYLNPLLQLGLGLGVVRLKSKAAGHKSQVASGRLRGRNSGTEVIPSTTLDLQPATSALGLYSGLCRLANQAARVGVGGVLISDLTPEEAGPYEQPFQSHNIDTVFLVSPTTTEARLKKIAPHCSGFIYLVARTGVTGRQTVFNLSIKRQIENVRKYSSLPVVIGFGMRTAEDVRRASAMADGVVVGSAVVETLSKLVGRRGWERKFEKYVARFVEATREA